MKLILSRKAFDSSAGGVANPIFDDGTMIALPIPDKQSRIRYRDLTVSDRNLGEVAAALTRGKTQPDHFAHLDPDLAAPTYVREPGWRPLFGQTGAAQTHLTTAGVGPGDLFLFFGWFRRVSEIDGRLRYLPGSPDLHVLWGWLQVAEVVRVSDQEGADWMRYHPHLGTSRGPNNTLYVAQDRLSLNGTALDMPGAGTFNRYNDRLRLTSPGQIRSTWDLPAWFAPTPTRPALSYHDSPDRWLMAGDRVQLRSVARGQEFVLDTSLYPESLPWVADLLAAASADPGSRP